MHHSPYGSVSCGRCVPVSVSLFWSWDAGSKGTDVWCLSRMLSIQNRESGLGVMVMVVGGDDDLPGTSNGGSSGFGFGCVEDGAVLFSYPLSAKTFASFRFLALWESASGASAKKGDELIGSDGTRCLAEIGIAGLVFVWRLYGDCMESWVLVLTVQSQFGTLLDAGSVLFF